MTPMQNLLSRLPGHKPAGNGQFAAQCPAHDDKHASLSVGTGDDGRVLIHCQAGCPTLNVIHALGLKFADLYPARSGHAKAAPGGRIIATYDYRDSSGQLLYQVVRFDPKDFRQRRPDGNGGWTWKLADTPRVLYRLPELLAADKGEWVFLPEGEKDADNLATIGLTATCNPGGAGKWKHLADDSDLHGRRVAIIADSDAPGRDHAQDVAGRLHGKAAEVKILSMPDGHKDVSDWLEAMDSREPEDLAATLVSMAEAAPEWAPAAVDAQCTSVVESVKDEAGLCSDIGNAARFTTAARGRFLWCGQIGKWLRYDGRRWADDNSLAVTRLAKTVALAIYEEARRAAANGDEKAEFLGKWALQSQKRERLAAMVDLARCELSISAAELDSDPWLLNVRNGTVDLRTGKISPHKPEDRISRLAPVDFDPAVKCPLWESVLTTIMAGDNAKITYLQRIFGMCLTGDVREQSLFVFYGTGANGKSVSLDTLVGLMGDYATEAAPDLLVDRQTAEHPCEQADLCGRRLVVASETEEGSRLRVQLVKRLTGNAWIKARFMRQDYFQFPRTHKLVMATNNRPVVREATHAIWRRLKMVPFTVTIPDLQQDKELLTKLRTEWPGILNWAIAGCLAWQAHGLDTPEAVDRATSDYEAEQDLLGDFLSSCCVVGQNAFAPRAEVYRAYLKWATDSGEKFPLDKNRFYERLRHKNFTDGKRRLAGNVTRGFEGIGLRSELFDNA